MARSIASYEDKKDGDKAYFAELAAKRNANAFFEKYNKKEIQELVCLTTCSWLLCGEDLNLPVDLPPGIIKQMNDFSHSNVVILAPVEPRVSLDYKVVHQILRELTVGIYCFNQLPFLSLETNYDQSTSCQLTPAYYDTLVGQMLINVDYDMKALWHGAFIPREKRIRFSELWRSSMGVDASGLPQTKKDMFTEFLTAGLMDTSDDQCYHGIYNKCVNEDPTYDPNSPEEEKLFSEYSDSVLLKLTTSLSSAKQHKNLFVFEGIYSLATAVRVTEDRLELGVYQRLLPKLKLQEQLVWSSLEKKSDVCRNLAYLKLVAFLVPFLVGLRKKMKIPDLSRTLPPFSGRLHSSFFSEPLCDDKLKTERELPPLLLGPGFTCKHFPYRQNEYFHLHGGIEVDVGTPPLDEGVPVEIMEAYSALQTFAANHLSELLAQDVTYKEHFPIPVKEFEGKSYHVISVELGALYSQANMVQWWEAMNAAIKSLRGKRLPLTDNQLHEQFKKTFGYKKGLKCKSLPFGLKAAAERGLAAVFYSLCRKTSPSHLGLLDEHGYSLMHHAAAHNHAHIISQLAAAGISLDQLHCGRFSSAGQSYSIAVKLFTEHRHKEGAAQCGSLDVLNCLLSLNADYRLVNYRGWMAVHFAAYYGQVACLRALCRKDQTLVEAETVAEYRTSPLLLAVTSGSMEVLDYLLSIGADWRKKDSEGNSAVHLAALYFHTQILTHLIELNLEDLPVWRLLIEMIKSEDYQRLEMGTRCLEVLSVRVESFWKDFTDAGGIPAILGLLGCRQPAVRCMAAAVVCHVSERAPVCELLVQHGAVPVLVTLLGSRQPELHSRCAVILADLATHGEQCQALIAQAGGLAPLVGLLCSDLQDVLVNVVRCIRALCLCSLGNQNAVAQAGGIPHLVEFLTIKSEALQGESCAALAELARGHPQNQEAICMAGAAGFLVQLLRSRSVALQVNAARALGTIADGNPAIQARFLKKSATEHLLRLLKVFQVEVKEQGAVSLWALAGETLKQQKMMAEHIGYHFILDLLMSSSDKMQYVGCQALIALSQNCRHHQDGLCKDNGVPPLVRLLRGSRTTERTLLSVIHALRILCIGVAHTRNPNSQKVIAEEKAIPSLVELLKHHDSLQVKVQAAQTLASVMLGNPELLTALWDQGDITYDTVLKLQRAQDKNICLEAGYALSLFAYNNTAQQRKILQAGGVPVSLYEPYLQSENETERAKASFQIVVLAKVVVETDQVTLSARGITVLVELLKSTNRGTIILTAELLASLAHTRPGIPDAIVTMGAVGALCAHLYSEEEEVQTACACALGYLTFNRHAHRLLLVECRNAPVIYDLLTKHLGEDAKISQTFTAEFKTQKSVGLPSLSLEVNGGPTVRQHKGTRKTTSATLGISQLRPQCLRSRSAPVLQPHSVRPGAPNPRVRFGEQLSNSPKPAISLSCGTEEQPVVDNGEG